MILVIIFGILQFDNSAEATVSVDSNDPKDYIEYKREVFNISNNTGHSEEPQIMKSGNNIYLLWIDDSSGSRDVYFKKSSDNGCTFNRTINLGIGEGGSLDPKMAISGDNIYVTWEQTPGNNGAVFFAKSNDNGASFDDAKNLGNNTGFNGLPQIAASGNNVYVVWTNNFQEKYGQIYFTRSTDNGASFNSPIILHELKEDGVGNKIFSPRIAVDPGNNNVYLAWQNGREVQLADVKSLISDVYFTRSTDNGASFDETTNLSNYSGWSVDPQIAVSQDNNVYVVRTNNAAGNEEIVFNKRINDVNTCINLNLENKPENLDVEKKINATQKAVNMAIVQATFTEAAYDKSFYMFYKMYKAEENKTSESPNATKYTDLL
jgi:hypothetical protein